MANLQSIIAETSKSYDNSRNAIQNQINAIAGDLQAQQNRINAQYAQQAKSLDNQRNWQAQASSMAASRNGGSFGGSSELANKKFYQQSYVPAVTQMQTNQANDLSNAESQANQTRLNLQSQLASLEDEASRYAMQRYDAAVAAEREEAYRQQQLALQRQQIAAQNAYAKYLQGAGGSASSPYSWSQNSAGGTRFYNSATGKNVTFGTYARGAGATNNAQILAMAQNALNAEEYARLARIVGAQGSTRHSALKITGRTDGKGMGYLDPSDRAFMGRLGLGF